MRTVYHLRELEVYRMAHLLSFHRGENPNHSIQIKPRIKHSRHTKKRESLSRISSSDVIINLCLFCAGAIDAPKLDVFLSHDWPTGIWQFGNCERLMQTKPNLRYYTTNPSAMCTCYSVRFYSILSLAGRISKVVGWAARRSCRYFAC